MKNIGLINKEQAVLIVVDVQERLLPVMHHPQELLDNVNRLVQGASILGVPTLVTEQYPKGLGNTCPEILIPDNTAIIEKMNFSCMQSDEVQVKLGTLNPISLI